MNKKILEEKTEKVVNRLLHLGDADYESDKNTNNREIGRGLIARDFGIEEWDWPQGVGLYGLCKLQELKGNTYYDESLNHWFTQNIEKGLPSKNINTTAPYLALLDYARRTNDESYKSMCLAHAEWLMKDLPRTAEGGFQHVTSAIGDRNGVELHKSQLWPDTLFMAVLFLCRSGHYFHRPDFVEESIHQFLIHIKYLWDKGTCLFHHGWTFQDRNNFGNIFWCRGNSWFTIGVMEFIESFRETPLPKSTMSYLLNTYIAQVQSLLSLQEKNGLWHTILDDSSSYCEVSGSAAIAAGILKGIRLGVLENSCLDAARRAIHGICNNISDDGTVLQVSAGTGIGMTPEHYKNILIRPMAYGQSLTLLALTEISRIDYL